MNKSQLYVRTKIPEGDNNKLFAWGFAEPRTKEEGIGFLRENNVGFSRHQNRVLFDRLLAAGVLSACESTLSCGDDAGLNLYSDWLAGASTTYRRS